MTVKICTTIYYCLLCVDYLCEGCHQERARIFYIWCEDACVPLFYTCTVSVICEKELATTKLNFLWNILLSIIRIEGIGFIKFKNCVRSQFLINQEAQYLFSFFLNINQLHVLLLTPLIISHNDIHVLYLHVNIIYLVCSGQQIKDQYCELSGYDTL